MLLITNTAMAYEQPFYHQDGNYYIGESNHTFKLLPEDTFETNESKSLLHLIGSAPTSATQQIYNSIIYTIKTKGFMFRNWFHITDTRVDYHNFNANAMDVAVKMVSTSKSQYANTKVESIDVELYEPGIANPVLKLKLNPKDVYLYFNQERNSESPGIIRVYDRESEEVIRAFVREHDLQRGLLDKKHDFTYKIRFNSESIQQVDFAEGSIPSSRMSLELLVDSNVFRYGLNINPVNLYEKVKYKIKSRGRAAPVCQQFFQFNPRFIRINR